MRAVTRTEFINRMPKKAIRQLLGHEVALRQKAVLLEQDGIYYARWDLNGKLLQLAFERGGYYLGTPSNA